MSINEIKQFDDIICDEVNVKALNRNFGTDEDGNSIELQYVRSQRSYNWRLGGRWVKNANEHIVEKLLNNIQL